MAHQAAGGQRQVPRLVPDTPEARAYLADYAAFLEAVPFPSLVVDRRWDVLLSNGPFRSLFRQVEAHPTAMPDDNFLRFVLFHPDAATVLGEHEASWCLPMLAHFARTVERCAPDPGLQAIRREIEQDPIMEVAYRHGVPHWLRVVGEGAAEHDGSVRPLIHPDPRWGATDCRIVVETTPTLDDLGCTRLTLVLRDARRPAAAARGRGARRGVAHLRVVPAAD
ncbi:hypothetical protein G3I20_17730 [Streptomyces sp. SID8111]|uniref:MmyB family transcriptional regulator n=1 Tax=Streptomyces sp. SID8111 TaxID=2706100 RepID=UPI0013C221C6|nr:hypothetical protein [Streptomyces sp. SID8111]NEC28358.1 hypothetical protein [Streptomyces sp. SID8111]